MRSIETNKPKTSCYSINNFKNLDDCFQFIPTTPNEALHSLFYLSSCMFVSNTQAIESLFALSEMSTEFAPIDEDARLLDIYSFSKDKQCIYACHSNYLCRIFDYDFNSYQCRLFQGDLETTGIIIISNSSISLVGQIKLNSELFSAYGSPCSACFNNRYLTCINSICDCPQYTYWTGSMCASQNLRGGQCSNSSQCRADLNDTCLQFFQYGRKINLFIEGGNLNCNLLNEQIKKLKNALIMIKFLILVLSSGFITQQQDYFWKS